MPRAEERVPWDRWLGGIVMVVWIVLGVGLANLVVGFALAVALERQIVVFVPSFKRKLPAESVSTSSPKLALPEDLVAEQVPSSWVKVLEDKGVHANSFVEAAIQVVRLEVDDYREALLDLEDRIRVAINDGDIDGLLEAVKSAVQLNEQWAERQTNAVAELTSRHGQFGDYKNAADRLENLLLDQTPAIKSHCQELREVGQRVDDSFGAAALHEIDGLVDLAHELRDAMLDALIAIIRDEDRFDTLDRHQQFDSSTRLHNRLGIELVFHNWWEQDIDRTRLVSVALIDVDRYASVNERLSTRVGDQVLGAFGRLLDEVISGRQTMHRVFRLTGQQFLMFLAETEPEAGAEFVEQVRMAVEATSFEYQGDSIPLTISLAVTSVLPNDDTCSLFDRLRTLTELAKRAGRNRTCLDAESGPTVIVPQPTEIKGRVISIE